jgi:hypothetical protein
MTTQTGKYYIGRQALLSVYLSQAIIKVPVLITDHRASFGRDDVMVSPVGGSGQGWVSVDRIQLIACS